MQPLEEVLLQDASSLLQFVSSISDLCARKSETFAHRVASERFFAYIEDLANATSRHLEISLRTTKTRELLQLRREIALLRVGWRFLHEFVKPALDADTLNLPTALVQGLSTRFHEIAQFRTTEFVFFHVDRFNYLNVTLSEFKKRASQISRCVVGPEFPPKLSIIGIPYSQSSSLFMNCLIPHEMGHYVFGELSLATKLKAVVEKELRSRLGRRRKPWVGVLVERITRWLEELFCDAFAVRLVGLCFSAAFVELFDLARYLDEKGALSKGRTGGETEFAEYPPDLLRLRQQYRRLDTDKWWTAIKAHPTDAHYISAIRSTKGLQDSHFHFNALRRDHNIDPTPILDTFFAVLPQIDSELDSATQGLESCASKWANQTETIESYLAQGVVPSSLCGQPGSEPWTPDITCLLNSAYRFYMLRMTDLLSRITDATASDIAQRVYWARRVESWTAKAIEDLLLVRRQEPR
ncbi:MAG: hypothetical protein WBG54_02715 [Acidobacteriaceae bacterium]